MHFQNIPGLFTSRPAGRPEPPTLRSAPDIIHSSDAVALRQSQRDLLLVRSCIVTSAMKVPQTNPRDSRHNIRHAGARSEQSVYFRCYRPLTNMVKRCAWGTCNGDDRYPERLQGAILIPFPKPKTKLELCLKWIKACGRPHSQLKETNINKHKAVCSTVSLGKYETALSGAVFYFDATLYLCLTT